MESAAVPDVESWRDVSLVNANALDDQLSSIGIVARELGPGVPVIQTVFSPITVAGYLVGKSKSRALRELRRSPELMRPALERIADSLVEFSRRSVAAGAAGVFFSSSRYWGKGALPQAGFPPPVRPPPPFVVGRQPSRGWVHLRPPCGPHPPLCRSAASAAP